MIRKIKGRLDGQLGGGFHLVVEFGHFGFQLLYFTGFAVIMPARTACGSHFDAYGGGFASSAESFFVFSSGSEEVKTLKP